jgi:hypothetical protein
MIMVTFRCIKRSFILVQSYQVVLTFVCDLILGVSYYGIMDYSASDSTGYTKREDRFSWQAEPLMANRGETKISSEVLLVASGRSENYAVPFSKS